MYNSVLLKDKADLNPIVLSYFPKVNILGTYEKPKLDKSKIKILSVKYSKIGKKTLSDYSNIKTIICRSHGIDNINQDLTSERQIQVIKTDPNIIECSEWIYDKIEPSCNNILIFGNGSISKKLQRKLKNVSVKSVDTRTSKDKIHTYIRVADCIISTLPLNTSTENYFNDEILTQIDKSIQFLSISRKKVFADGFLNSDKLHSIDTDKKHLSWQYGLIEDEDHFNHYGKNLKSVIDGLL